MLELALWPDGAFCPRCNGTENVRRRPGWQIGLHYCRSCHKQFTIKMGTIFERTHLPLNLWFQAVYLGTTGNFRINPGVLKWTLAVQEKPALLMIRRISLCMDGGKAMSPTERIASLPEDVGRIISNAIDGAARKPGYDQITRFRIIARALLCDESEARFRAVLKSVRPEKPVRQLLQDIEPECE